MNTSYLILGGNKGKRAENISKAIELIEKKAGTITKKSAIFETAAWGNTNQAAFLNQVIELKTNLNPFGLLKSILEIEIELGRMRDSKKWTARTIDIDILFFDAEIIDTPELKIPHPYIQERKFVLIPLMELASNLMHPISKKTIQALLLECTDNLEVKQWKK